MSDLEARYRRLLRWYPRIWRAAHGDVLIGTAMDAAEAEGRSRPTTAEARSMALHGFGERFTLRTALYAAVGALLFAFAGTLVLIAGIGTIAQVGGGWIPLALNLFAATLLTTASALALLRHVGLRPDRVLPVLALAILAWACAFFAAWSWSVGFDEADEGLVRTPFSLAFGALLLAGWIIGGAAVALVVDAMARSLPRGIRWAAGGVAAVVCPQIIGIVAYPPFSGLVVGLALTATSVILLTRTHPTRRPAAAADPAQTITPRLRCRVGMIALCSAALGALCAAFALAGSTIAPGIDSTRAMQLGLSAGTLAGIPLAFAAAWLLTARRPSRAALVWSGAVLMMLGTVTHVVATMLGATASGDFPWISVIPLAVGVGVLAYALTRTTPLLRGLLAVATSMAVLLPMWIVLVAAGFLLPIVAAVLAIWGLRRSEGRASAASAHPIHVP